MTEAIKALSVVLAAYLIGAIPFGFLVARLRGVDILRHGSGNIGATNVGRVLGKPYGILVFVLDFLKGAVPTLVADILAHRHADELGEWLSHDGLRVLAGLAAFLGHLFPVYLNFKGGKGVATGAGVVVVLMPIPAMAALVTWVAVVFLTRYVSMASLAAALALVVMQLTVVSQPFGHEHATLSAFSIVAAVMVFIRHRENIDRLRKGNENKIRGVAAVSTLVKGAHVIALGLWFGSAVFFNLIAAPAMFQTFKELAANPSAVERTWLPPLSEEQKHGTLLFGIAVSPLFPRFFLLQRVCGLIVALTSLAWSRERPGERVHRIRAWLALAALGTVVIGWPLTQKVSSLRFLRYQGDEAARAAADATFTTWHLYSLLLSLLTVVLVTGLMALAARLPVRRDGEQ
jgi:acyl-phosphate glycerol 3-phosphate acyltransferase